MKSVIICKDNSHVDKPLTLWVYDNVKDFDFYKDYFKKHQHWEIVFIGEVQDIKGVEI